MQLSFLQNMLSASVSGVHRKIINQSSNHLGDYCCDRQLMLKPNKKKPQDIVTFLPAKI